MACAVAAVAACHHDAVVEPLPRAAMAHYLAARLDAAGSDWAGMADELAAAAVAAPGEAMIAVELARAQARSGDLRAARATILAARDKWPDHPQVWLASGDLLAKASPGEAAYAYKRAIALDPDEERAYLGLVRVEPDDAEATLRALIHHVPGSVEGRYKLATLIAPREPDAAIVQLRLVLEGDPDQIDARLDLAHLLRRRGDLAGAIANTRSAFDRTGQALDVAEELFWLLCEADQVTAALDLLTLLDDEHSDVDALALVARLQRGLGRLDAAREVAGRVAALDADAGAIVLAETELAAGDAAGAAARVLAIVPASSRFTVARRVAAEAELAAGDPAAALAALEPALAAHPADDGLALEAAFALVDRGRVAEARALIPADHDVAAARVDERAGDTASAVRHLEHELMAHPDDAFALDLAGYLLADAGQRLDAAADYLERARDLAPGDPSVLDSYGWLLFRQHNTRDAVHALDRAARLAPREPEILLHLATAWAADGAPHEAARVLAQTDGLLVSPRVRKRIDALRSTLPPVQ
nr:tetratricopeptide repeat protein [Kofleriaceae bacterium]